MTTTYDPNDSRYLDEAGTRGELTRVFDICGGCRQCVDLCGVFPTLFELLGRLDGTADEGDAGRLTPAEQDRVVDECVHCKRCLTDCPYRPGRHERAVDVPRLMLRALAMRRANGLVSWRDRLGVRMVTHTGVVGRVARAAAPFVSRMIDAPEGSVRRRAMSKLIDERTVRRLAPYRLAPYSDERFSTWLGRRTRRADLADAADRVAARSPSIVYATCRVEHHQPELGRDIVTAGDRRGTECELTRAGCCGGPWLRIGEVDRFRKLVDANVATLASEIEGSDADIVVPDSTCADVLRHEYVDYVDPALRAQADRVARRIRSG